MKRRCSWSQGLEVGTPQYKRAQYLHRKQNEKSVERDARLKHNRLYFRDWYKKLKLKALSKTSVEEEGINESLALIKQAFRK